MADTARRVINPASLPPAPGWSHGIAAGGFVFGSGMLATDYATGLLPEARAARGAEWIEEPFGTESRVVIDMIAAVLDEAGADIRHDLLRMWQWIVARYPDDESYRSSRSAWPLFPSGSPYARALREKVGDPLRSSTGIGVRQLPVPGAIFSADFLAALPVEGREKHGYGMPDGMAAPHLGYSPSVGWGDWVFLAGFGATDFAGDWGSDRHHGEPSLIAPEARVNPYIWVGSEIEVQTRYTLEAMARIAEKAGTSLDRCVKADVTLTHPSDFAGMDRVWREFFPDSRPARNVVTGTQLVIKGLRVEVAMLLIAGDATIERETVHVAGIPEARGHAPQAIHAGDFLFTSSLLPVGLDGAVDPALALDDSAPLFRRSARGQTEAVAGQLAELCAAVGVGLADVCKVQAFLSDLEHLPGMLDAWEHAFPSDPPALSAVATGGPDPLLAPGAAVQWDAIVYAPRGQ
jgi:enamine deaminase RidA (YjgF/YER057c/UK114 family)